MKPIAIRMIGSGCDISHLCLLFPGSHTALAEIAMTERTQITVRRIMVLQAMQNP